MNSDHFGWLPRQRQIPGHRAGQRISLAVIAATLLAACEKPAVSEPPPPMVQLMEIKNSPIHQTATLIGQLDSPQNVEVRARVEAFVEEIAFTEGGKVKQGDLLFRLDRLPYVEKLAVAKAALAEATVSQKKYEIDVARLKPLAASGGVSQQDMDNAQASLEASLASVESAKAKVESAQLDLGYCDVKAPIDGLIGAKEVSVGDLVGKGQPTLLATMSSLDPMWFYCNISEADYILTRTRVEERGKDLSTLPLTLILPGGKEHAEKGRIVFFDRAVNIKTGTMRMRVEFPNPTELLRPGMFARARIEAGAHEGILIPERALLELQGQPFVWLVDAEQKVHQQPVRLGDTFGSDVAVLEGLKPGDRIILEGIHKAHEGGRVNVLPAATGTTLPPR
jgi:membrane fusion protein (multidrug efflux system)